MNDNTISLQLRPLPGSPWVRNCWAYNYSVLDLRGHIPEGSIIQAIRSNGEALKRSRHDDHPHIVTVSPLGSKEVA